MGYERTYQTFLRVFEPLEAHPEFDNYPVSDNRERIEIQIAADADKRLVSLPVNPIPRHFHSTPLFLTSEHTEDNITRVCPVQEDVRGWHALDVLTESWPSMEIDIVVPRAARRRAASDRAEWLQGRPNVQVYTRTATWEVPPEWLVAVVADEDEVVTTEAGVRVRTPLLTASARAEWAADILMEKAPGNDISQNMREISDWLDHFDLSSIVELDYAGLTADIWPDSSSGAVHRWVEALDADDEAAAEAALGEYVSQWAPVTSLARSS